MFYSMFRKAHRHNHMATAFENASSAKAKSDHLYGEVKRLTQQVDRLTLASQALWELLRDHGDLTEDKLASKMLEVDLRDGVQDGRIGPGKTHCPSCKRLTGTHRDICLYCGADVDRDHAFQ